MGKFLRISLLTMMILVLVAGTALAGTVTTLDSSGNRISIQALGQARNVLINGPAASGAIRYVPGQSLVSTNLLNITFDAGVSFQGGTTVYVCPNDVAMSTAGNASVSASGSNNLTVQLNANAANITPSNAAYITTYPCSTQCTSVGSNCAVNVTFSAGASGVKKVYVNAITSGGTSLDSGSNNIANIANEFTPTLSTANTITIDYQGTGSDGKKFTGNSTVAGSNNVLSVVKTDMYYGAANNITGGNASNAGLSANVAMYFKDTQEWQGVTKIYAANTMACPSSSSSSAIGVINAPSSGTATVNVSNAFSSTVHSNITACFEVSGNTVLQTRVIKGAYKIDFGSGGVGIDKSSDFENIQIWEVNAYQGLITWLVKSDALKTYCLVHNNGAQAANVYINVFSTEQGSTTSTISLGSIGAGKSQLYIFGDQVGAGSSTYDLTAIQANERYSAIKTVTAPQDQVAVTCNQFDPAGAKRLVPVLTGKDGPKWKN